MFETGHFATLWREMAKKLGLEAEFVAGDWRHGVDPAMVEDRLAADKAHRFKAVCVVHNETSTGVASRIAEIRAAIDRAKHPALFMVDTISSLPRSIIGTKNGGRRYCRRLTEGADAAARTRLQRCLREALAASKTARLPRSYWDWQPMLQANDKGYFPIRRRPTCSTA